MDYQQLRADIQKAIHLRQNITKQLELYNKISQKYWERFETNLKKSPSEENNEPLNLDLFKNSTFDKVQTDNLIQQIEAETKLLKILNRMKSSSTAQTIESI